jgi:hypothetical protein
MLRAEPETTTSPVTAHQPTFPRSAGRSLGSRVLSRITLFSRALIEESVGSKGSEAGKAGATTHVDIPTEWRARS